MRKQRPRPIRNKLNLSDARQVRLVKKRLGLSDTELSEIVGKIGNSLSAISKEVALQRAHDLPEPINTRMLPSSLPTQFGTPDADQ